MKVLDSVVGYQPLTTTSIVNSISHAIIIVASLPSEPIKGVKGFLDIKAAGLLVYVPNGHNHFLWGLLTTPAIPFNFYWKPPKN